MHEAELGELGTLEPLGDGTHRLDVDQPAGLTERVDVLGGLGGVGDRGRVGHGEHRGVPPDGGRPRARGHGLGVLPAGLAQVGVEVDEPGQRDEPLDVESVEAVGVFDGAHLGEVALAHGEVAAPLGAVVVEPGGAGQQQVAHAATSSPASRW